MARTTANDYTPGSGTAAPPLITDGDHLCAVIDVEKVYSKDQTSWAMGITLLTADGQTGRIDVRGIVDRGKGVWVERVAVIIAGTVAGSLPKVPNAPKQPAEDFDWESEADLRAVMLGGTFWATIGTEAGQEKPNGGFYADKNTVYWPGIGTASREDIETMRASEGWKQRAETVRTQRDRAIAEWRAGLERAANGGSATDQVDDAIPF